MVAGTVLVGFLILGMGLLALWASVIVLRGTAPGWLGGMLAQRVGRFVGPLVLPVAVAACLYAFAGALRFELRANAAGIACTDGAFTRSVRYAWPDVTAISFVDRRERRSFEIRKRRRRYLEISTAGGVGRISLSSFNAVETERILTFVSRYRPVSRQ
jgi:hypothetical protein